MARDDRLTPEQRLDAVAEILACGVHRWLIKQRQEAAKGAAESEETEETETAQPQ